MRWSWPARKCRTSVGFSPDIRPAARVRRLGVLTDAEKRDFFAGIDLFALPSRSDSFGLVLLEAWANGVPNVAYRAGGPADLIRHGVDGILAPCGDVDQLAGSIDSLIRDTDARRRMGTEGQRRVGQDFAWEDKLELVRRTMEQARSCRSRAAVGHCS